MISFLFVDSERVWRGGQEQLLSLLRGLLEHGHLVRLACHPRTLLEERAREIGAEVFPVSVRSEIGPIAFLKLLAVLYRTQPDIVAFNTPRPILIGSIASRLISVRARIIFRRVNFPLRRNPLTRLKYNWGIDCIIAISESIRCQLQAGGIPASRIRTIYEGMDLSPYPKRARPAPGKSETPVVVGTIAHLSQEKGLTYLIKAAACIPDARTRLRFVVVGDGECRKELEEEVQACGLEACFQFVGFQSRATDYLRSFGIFVLPSLSEGLSSAILTAMASSLPVVATDVGGIPELIRDGENGILVPPKDPGALARAIDRLARNPDERYRMGRAGRDLMEERFTLPRKILETERLCASFLQEKEPASRAANA